MINSEHQMMLREIVATQDKNRIDEVFHQVLYEELGTIKQINNEEQETLNSIFSLLSLPYKIINGSLITKKKNYLGKDELYFIIANVISMLIVALISVINIICSFCFALFITIALFVFLRKRKSDLNDNNNINPVEMKYCINADDLISITENILSYIKHFFNVLKNPSDPTPTKFIPLHECFPNILSWLQTVYAESMDFGEHEKKYMLGRINSIAKQCYYEVILYDGNNMNMFINTIDEHVKEPEMDMPAFIYKKTGKVILPGNLFIPQK
jgi:hypothetical protein